MDIVGGNDGGGGEWWWYQNEPLSQVATLPFHLKIE
jgi:hypothetical protein